MNATLLWTNPNPNSSTGATDIKFENLNDYDYLLVESKESTSINNVYQSLLPIAFERLTSSSNYYTAPITSTYTGQTNWVVCGRKAGFRSDKKTLWFDVNSIIGLTSIWNDRNIPIKIFGIKGKINGIEK